MAKRGVYKHLKRIHAPKSWMLSKVGGIWAMKPSQGPHKLRDCIPLNLILRTKLRLALNGKEAKMIVKAREGNISIDGKVRRDPKYPVGIMDIVTTHPETLEVFAKYGMGCIGCAAARFENLEAGAKVHGIDVDEMVDAMNKILEKNN